MTVPTLVRIVEWLEWLPTEIIVIGENRNQQGQIVTENLPIHNGVSGFISDDTERLLSVDVSPAGKLRQVETENGEVSIYGLFHFRARLAKNCTTKEFNGQLESQRAPLVEQDEREKKRGRNRAEDLVIVENNPRQK